MVKNANARRYAQAIFEIALEKKELETWQADLEEIVGALSYEAFLTVLDSPKIRVGDKENLLKKVLPGISPLTLNLVKLLISRSGIVAIIQIAEEYRRLVNEYHGIAAADVVTAVPLDEQDKKELAEKLGTLVGARVDINTAVDPAILGGFIVHVGGKLLDGSTRSKLVALKKEIRGG